MEVFNSNDKTVMIKPDSYKLVTLRNNQNNPSYGTRKMSAVLVACCGMVYFEIVRCFNKFDKVTTWKFSGG